MSAWVKKDGRACRDHNGWENEAAANSTRDSAVKYSYRKYRKEGGTVCMPGAGQKDTSG